MNKKAKQYAESCDNESGGFLSHQLIAIREKAFIAGQKEMQSRLVKTEVFFHMDKAMLLRCADNREAMINYSKDKNLQRMLEIIEPYTIYTEKEKPITDCNGGGYEVLECSHTLYTFKPEL